MALDFPANPINGQVYDSYVYNSTVGAWQAREDSATVAITSPTAPATANNGDIWYNSNTGVSYVYYSDGTSAQWVEIVSSAVPLLDTKANLSGANFTGNISAPQLVSTTATGTTPLSITSTTLVSNLNADLLDGNHATAFSPAAGSSSITTVGTITSGTWNGTTLAVANGGTGATTLTSGGYLKGAGTAAITSQTGIPAGDVTSGTLSSARLPSGTVLQVVESGTGANTATVTGQYSWGNTGISATITPRSTSSRIKVTANITCSCSAAGWVFMRVLRGSTPVGNGTSGGTLNFSTLTYIADYGRLEPMNACFVDSPATTAATTYTIQFAVYTGTGYLNRRGADALFGSYSNIVLEEIA